jgi:hypothetical protein
MEFHGIGIDNNYDHTSIRYFYIIGVKTCGEVFKVVPWGSKKACLAENEMIGRILGQIFMIGRSK